jgi:hypothetical protein
MKKLSYLFKTSVFIVLVSLCLISCEKDINDSTPLKEKEAFQKKDSPSVDSFQFYSRGNSLYAHVRGIRFNVVSVDNNGFRQRYSLMFNQEVYFSCPKEYRGRRGVVTEDLAAQLATRALSRSMSIISNRYGRSYAPQSRVENDFKQVLENEFNNISNGGHVQFNSSHIWPPSTYYQTNF